MSAVKETPVALPGGKEALQENEKKWGPDLMKAGWTVLPNMIFMRQRALGLDSMDINILLILLSHWWTAESLPFPSKKTIAEAIGCDTSTVRRRIQAMEAAGFLKRIERRVEHDRSKTNQYDFSGLIKAATPYAQEELQARQEGRQGRAKRIRRKGKPQLKVVPGEGAD
ncbi:helix-turn-helix domain-containing protein (plasmid) [Thauera butanivorans]|jgi:DNA-binding MarR family transcriptional regulator|uniref:helix-turn-helix domain-containing protein n=1 Tax=Thauera butanivorans TaxID=86174 RepID=UPI002A3D1BAF|nr:helix-turn-helix domain-containing protein [Gammaproteobacteria bacterium]